MRDSFYNSLYTRALVDPDQAFVCMQQKLFSELEEQGIKVKGRTPLSFALTMKGDDPRLPERSVGFLKLTFYDDWDSLNLKYYWSFYDVNGDLIQKRVPLDEITNIVVGYSFLAPT